MLELLGAILTGTCTEKAREHDGRVAREYDEQNRRAVSKHQTRNNLITSAAGLAVLGALAMFGNDKLGDKNKTSAPKKI